MPKKLLGGALGVVRHIVWYVSHQLGGEPREREQKD